MSKKNLPNIPIYIGDWERDCNVLSLESEMAWMKIIFKMHLSGKQSVYKSSTKGLQILWKSSPEKVSEIMEELLFNDICEITAITGGYEFLCRRLKKENDISKVRSEAVLERYKDSEKEKKPKNKSTKPLQTTYKTLQNADNDYENEVEYEDISEAEKKKKKLKIPKIENDDFETFWNLYGKKVDTKNCRQKFKALKPDEVAKILSVVAAYVRSTPDVKYRKNPMTWLNGKCWDDEIIINTDKNGSIANIDPVAKNNDLKQRAFNAVAARFGGEG